MIKVSPSVLAANFSELGKDVREVARYCDYIHFDVMDGVFVPNISFGFPVLTEVRKQVEIPLDVHLMIDRPVRYVERFCNSGADIVTIHLESDSPDNIAEAVRKIKNSGKKCGMSIKPCSTALDLMPYIKDLDLVLVMTVEPGFGGQSFMHERLETISAVRSLIKDYNPCCELEVDGGINYKTAALCVEAGADVLVAGSYVFGSNNREAAVSSLRNCRI